MGKRLRREKSICNRISPRSTYLAPHTSFYCYERDVWTAVAAFLDGRSIVMLAVASKWFYENLMDDSIWKLACLRDLQVRLPKHQVSFKWSKLYASAFDGTHSYSFRQPEKHIDWMRIGAFSFESPVALLTEGLKPLSEVLKGKDTENTSVPHGCFLLKDIKTGIWIADLQLVRCPVCDQSSCEGTMQTLDARHIELFLYEGYQDGSWDFQVVGSQDIKENIGGASAAILDAKHINDPSTSEISDLNKWVGKPDDWQPKAMLTYHACAVNTNLQKNEGIHVKFQIMRSGAGGEVVSIRISQQLL